MERGVWDVHHTRHSPAVSPEPSPLQQKSRLSSQDLRFPTQIKSQPENVSRATAMLGARLCWDRIWAPLDQPWGGEGSEGPRGCESPPSLTEMLQCHLVTAGRGQGCDTGTCSSRGWRGERSRLWRKRFSPFHGFLPCRDRAHSQL